LACDRENYVFKSGSDPSKVIYDISNSKGNLLTLNDIELNLVDAEAAIQQMMTFMRSNFKMEGMYVVENLLLRPDFGYIGDNATDQQFMPVCIDVNGEYCNPLDPYSFRVCVVLPGYSIRLRNTSFRTYVEKLIRMETPAHILPRICFIGRFQMEEFEALYPKWLDAKQLSIKNNTPMDSAINNSFIDLLERLYTVYPEGQLSDCDDDTIETNPIVLNKTNLGSLQGGSSAPTT